MKYPSEIHEEAERKLLRECAYTRNKHIEIEERYKSLVDRNSSKVDFAALESVLRKKETVWESEIPEENEVVREITEETVGDEVEPVAEEVSEEDVSEEDFSGNVSEAEEFYSKQEVISEGEKEVSFAEILKLQASIAARMKEQSSDDFIKQFFGSEESTNRDNYPVYNEPIMIKTTVAAAIEEPLTGENKDSRAEKQTKESETIQEENIEAVEVDEIFLPEEEEGLGMVFATPIENKEDKPGESEVNVKKSIGSLALAAAVLMGGVLLVCAIWPL